MGLVKRLKKILFRKVGESHYSRRCALGQPFADMGFGEFRQFAGSGGASAKLSGMAEFLARGPLTLALSLREG
jgi:hypothetical protein